MASASPTAVPRPVALTIAGSDSGGGAGIQADLRVFHRLGAFGTSAITAVTAQNLQGVTDVVGLDSPAVRAQIEAVLVGFPVRAVKTGMLWSRAVVETVSETIGDLALPLVVDPVMVATSGSRLLDEGAIDAYRRLLLPRAALATPNLDEAAVLLDCDRIDGEGLRDAAAALHELLRCPVLVKGGHLDGDPVDVLCHADGLHAWRHPRVPDVNNHGSGCMLSSAITACLAGGDDLVRACERGLAFVHDALARALTLGADVRLAGIENARDDVAVLERLD